MENRSAVTEELLGLEKKYWQAMQNQDLDTALSLTDFPCIVTSAHGARTVDKDQFVKMFEAHRGDSIRTFEFGSNPEVRLLNESTAVIAYEIHSVVNRGGQEKSVDAVDTSTWIKRDGKWVCALHTETEREQIH
jgi:uncharacterized protein (TIGR02246 family)